MNTTVFHELHLGISTDFTLNCNCGNSAVVCTSRPAPVVAPRRVYPNPCRRTATAESPLPSAMLDQGTCVAQQRACQPDSAEHMPVTTTGMSTSWSKRSGPEHLCGTPTGMSSLCRGTAQWYFDGLLNSLSHRESFCATTGMKMTVMSCTCGIAKQFSALSGP